MSEYLSWTEAELLQLIAQKVRERSNLEYKASDSLRPRGKISRDQMISELSKDVSAMANADGGLIIYGMTEKNHEPVGLDGGFLLSEKTEPTHEWLEQTIRGNVHPAPDGLYIKPIDLSDQHVGRVAFLVATDRSARGCQCQDGRYYRRRNFLNEFLEDWEVRELMTRTSRAVVELTQQRLTLSVGGPYGGLHSYVQAIELHNRGDIRVRDWKVVIKFPAEYLDEAPQGATKVIVRPSPREQFEAQQIVVTNQNSGPLFPGESVSVVQLRWRVDHELYDRAQRSLVGMSWEVYADDLSPTRNQTLIRRMHEF